MATYGVITLPLLLIIAICHVPAARSQASQIVISESSDSAAAAITTSRPATIKASTSGFSAPAGTFPFTLPDEIAPASFPGTQISAAASSSATPRLQPQTGISSGGPGPVVAQAQISTVAYSRFYIRNNCRFAGTVSISISYVPPLTSPALHALGYFAVAPGTTAYIAPTTNRFIYFNAFGGSVTWAGPVRVLVPIGNTASEVRNMIQVDLGPTFRDYTLQLNC